MTEILVTKAAPPLKTQPRHRRPKYPFARLEVGDMFFMPHLGKNTFFAFASRWGKRLGRKFSTRLTFCRLEPSTDQWTPCDAKDPGAVQGVAVRREA